MWLAFERLLGKSSIYAKFPGPLRVALTFLIVNLAWVFFRADDLSVASRYLASLFNLGAGSSANASCSAPFFTNPAMLSS